MRGPLNRGALKNPMMSCWIIASILYYTILYYTILYYTILYYTTSSALRPGP